MTETVCHLVQLNIQWQEFITLISKASKIMLEYKLKCITVIVDLETQAILILCLLSWIYTSAILAVVWNMNGHCVPRFVLQKLHELYKHLEWAPLRDNCVIWLILYKCVAVYHQVIPELQQTGWCWLPLLPLVLATLPLSPTCSGHCPSRITPYLLLSCLRTF